MLGYSISTDLSLPTLTQSSTSTAFLGPFSVVHIYIVGRECDSAIVVLTVSFFSPGLFPFPFVFNIMNDFQLNPYSSLSNQNISSFVFVSYTLPTPPFSHSF